MRFRPHFQHTGLLLVLVLAVMSSLVAVAFAEESPSYSGTYRITVTTDKGATHTIDIGVEDIGNGQVEVTAAYEGIPFTLIGEVTGDAAEEGAAMTFKVDIPQLFNGQAAATIVQTNSTFKLTGEGSGKYSWSGASGEGAGTGVAQRTSTALLESGVPSFIKSLSDALRFVAPAKGFPTPSPIKTAAAAAIAAVGALAMGSTAAVTRRSIKAPAQRSKEPTIPQADGDKAPSGNDTTEGGN